MPESNPTTIDDLMARVGYLFLHWGFLENELRLRRGDVASLQTLPGVTDAYRIRNLIAHGILEAAAYPKENASPYLTCRSQNGARNRVTLEEIGAAIQALEQAKIELLRHG